MNRFIRRLPKQRNYYYQYYRDCYSTIAAIHDGNINNNERTRRRRLGNSRRGYTTTNNVNNNTIFTRATTESAVISSNSNSNNNYGSVHERSDFQEHQKKCSRLSHAEECRTLLKLNRFGVLSTISTSKNLIGFPTGSVVAYATTNDTTNNNKDINNDNDDNDNVDSFEIICAFSRLSSHTRDIENDARFAITITNNNSTNSNVTMNDMSDARMTIHGKMEKIEEDDVEMVQQAREIYLSCHPDAFWIDFGDFSFFRMTSLLNCRLVSGFGRAGSVSSSSYWKASPCPVSRYMIPVCSHMNEDHTDAIILMIQDVLAINDNENEIESARMVNIDKYGIDVKAARRMISSNDNNDTGSDELEEFKMRLPFPREAKTRKDLKDLIVEMTKKAAKSKSDNINN